MKESVIKQIKKAIKIVGNQSSLARALNVSHVTIHYWITNPKYRNLHPKHADLIEKITRRISPRDYIHKENLCPYFAWNKKY
jgi:DNA-binding transcriptional regulator YdaS (Cro superfamily)